MLPRSKYISSVKELVVGIIWIFVLAFLLEVWKIRIVIDCFVKVMNIFVSDIFSWISKQLMIIIKAKLSLSIAYFIGI